MQEKTCYGSALWTQLTSSWNSTLTLDLSGVAANPTPSSFLTIQSMYRPTTCYSKAPLNIANVILMQHEEIT